ncbi:hypothetical protein ACP179_01475 (plasmid) [Xenorhabdus stockiae]|uniref:hypothetical protein n=1 Tax=Xenorhabdus stockiae TaxID=351614 RepID=UPI003CE87C90
MKHIGFMGGSFLIKLNSPSEMVDFMDILHKSAINSEEKEVIDRLYKKYVKIEQLDIILLVVNRAKNQLSPEMQEIFSQYFDGVETCIESAKLVYDRRKIFLPLRIGITDIPDYIYDKDRPLEEYDALGAEDLPFWLR